MTAPGGTGDERQKLMLSLAANAATRIPGAAGILLFLPLAREGLGVAQYAALLAALSLGGAVTFVFGGVGITARRMIGAAHGAHDHTAQAEAFQSLVLLSLVLGIAAALVVVAWQWWTAAPSVLMLVALIPVASAAANLFDNVRAAYNEHYVTASIQFAVQLTLYAAGIGIGVFARDPLLVGLVMGGGSMIASVLAGVSLLRAHPALRGRRPRQMRAVITQVTGAGLADGMLMSGLALAVVLVEARADPALGAWFATIVRLFQTFLAPVLLVLLPVGSYVRMGWGSRDAASRRRVVVTSFAGGLAYGTVVALALATMTGFYIGRVMGLDAPAMQVSVAVFALLGTIVLYKSYTSIAFLLLDLRHLAIGSAAVVATSFAVAALPLSVATALIGYAVVTAVGLLLLTADSVRRYRGE